MKVLIPLQTVQKNYKVVLDDYRNSETSQKGESYVVALHLKSFYTAAASPGNSVLRKYFPISFNTFFIWNALLGPKCDL